MCILPFGKKMEELFKYFDNTLILRVLYPVSSNLDSRGLIGKLARFERVDKVSTSVTVLDDLCPLIPALVTRKVTGILNFVNRGTLSYISVIEDIKQKSPIGWKQPRVEESAAARPACELDVSQLAAASGCDVPEAAASVRRIIAGFSEEVLQALTRNSKL